MVCGLGLYSYPSVLKFHNDRSESLFFFFNFSAEHSGILSSSKNHNHEFWDVFLYYFCDNFFIVHFQISYWEMVSPCINFSLSIYSFLFYFVGGFLHFYFPTLLLLPFLFLLSFKKWNKKRTQPKNFYFEIILGLQRLAEIVQSSHILFTHFPKMLTSCITKVQLSKLKN